MSIETTIGDPNLYQSFKDLKFVEVSEGVSGALEIPIIRPEDNTLQGLHTKIEDKLGKTHWWLMDYWREKGLPGEQFVFKAGELEIEVFNFHTPLTPSELAAFQKAVGIFANVSGSLKHRTFLIDDLQAVNVHSGEDLNGENDPNAPIIKIQPNARRDIPHRIAEVGNFPGTLIHEGAHSLADEKFKEGWGKQFGWSLHLDAPIRHPNGHVQYDIAAEPARCITEYARFNRDEDFAESFLASIIAPERLDPERLAFLQRRFDVLTARSFNGAVDVIKRSGNEVVLPRIPETVLFYRREPKAYIRTAPPPVQ